MATKLSMPIGSWPLLKRVIRAYGTVGEDETATVEDVASRAGMQRPVVSSQNKFLREIGILSLGENKLTPMGMRLAQCLSLQNEDLIVEALQEIVRASPALNQFVAMVQARGTVKTEVLRGEITLAAEGPSGNRVAGIGVRTVLELLHDAKLIQLTDDVVKVWVVENGAKPPIAKGISPNEPTRISPSTSPNAFPGGRQSVPSIPLPLGPSRLAYIQLPDDWQPKELGKLIKLLQIALGEDDGA